MSFIEFPVQSPSLVFTDERVLGDLLDEAMLADRNFFEVAVRGNRRREEREGSRRRPGDRFLKSPPLDALIAAGKLPGKALLVYMAIRHRLDLTEKHRKFETTLPVGVMQDFRVDRRAKDRALASLRSAGLISIKRSPGHPARISLSDAWRVRRDDCSS
jgi:hypothetical protein